MDTYSVDIPEAFTGLIDNAILRLNYLYPDLQFSVQGSVINVQGEIDSVEQLKKEITYLIYREKVYEEYLPIRKKIYEDI